MKHEKSYFTRIITTSFLILIIPTLILGTMFYHEFLIEYQQRLYQSYISRIEQFKNSSSANLMVLNQLIVRISNKRELTRFQLSQGGLNNMEGVELINDFNLSNSFMEEIFIYYPGLEYIYNSRGKFGINNLSSTYNGIDSLLKEYMTEDHPPGINILLGPVRIDSTLLSEKSYIVFAHSLLQSLDSKAIVIFFLIGEQNFWDPIRDINDIKISLETINGRSLSSFSRLNSAIEQDKIKEIILEDEGKRFQYRIWIDLHGISEISSPRRLSFFLTMLAIIIMGSIIALILSFINIRPIKKLILVNEQLQKNLLDISKDNKIFKRNEFLNRLVKKKEQPIKNELIEKMVFFDHPWFFITIVYTDPIDNLLLHSFHEFELTESKGYGFKLEGEDLIVLIINSQSNKGELQLNLIHQIYNATDASSSTFSQTRVACGSFVQSMEEINASFYEAVFKLEREFVTPQINRDSAVTSTHFFPNEELNMLSLSVKCGDINRAKDIINTITERLGKFFFSIFRIKMICLEIGYNLLQVLEKMGFETDKFHEGIFYFTGLSDWQKNMQEILEDTEFAINRLKKHKAEQAQHEMIIYINNNFTHYNFSLATLADHFNCSPAYASKLIKKILGCPFSEYLFTLKSEKVKKDLGSSELSIQKIIHNAGYRDASNFIRRFKSTEGITPGQYRQIILNTPICQDS